MSDHLYFCVMSFDYKATFESAKKAYEELAKRRADSVAEIDREMALLKQTMDLLAPRVDAAHPPLLNIGELMGAITGGFDPNIEIGLTSAIRSVLRDSRNRGEKGLSPVEVRDRLVASNFDLSKDKYDNALAAIHTVLKRVGIEVQTDEGKKYRLPFVRRRATGNLLGLASPDSQK